MANLAKNDALRLPVLAFLGQALVLLLARFRGIATRAAWGAVLHTERSYTLRMPSAVFAGDFIKLNGKILMKKTILVLVLLGIVFSSALLLADDKPLDVNVVNTPDVDVVNVPDVNVVTTFLAEDLTTFGNNGIGNSTGTHNLQPGYLRGYSISLVTDPGEECSAIISFVFEILESGEEIHGGLIEHVISRGASTNISRDFPTPLVFLFDPATTSAKIVSRVQSVGSGVVCRSSFIFWYSRL